VDSFYFLVGVDEIVVGEEPDTTVVDDCPVTRDRGHEGGVELGRLIDPLDTAVFNDGERERMTEHVVQEINDLLHVVVVDLECLESVLDGSDGFDVHGSSCNTKPLWLVSYNLPQGLHDVKS